MYDDIKRKKIRYKEIREILDNNSDIESVEEGDLLNEIDYLEEELWNEE